jgi:hypothetical protein
LSITHAPIWRACDESIRTAEGLLFDGVDQDDPASAEVAQLIERRYSRS